MGTGVLWAESLHLCSSHGTQKLPSNQTGWSHLWSQDVRGHPVRNHRSEVMTAHPGTQQCVLQAAEGLDVQVVGGLVEQQHVAPIFRSVPG